MTWLVRDDDVLAVAEVATSRGQRTRGLMGRDEFEGALVIRPCRQVHTFGMRFPIDVAFLDDAGRPIRVERSVGRRRLLVCRGAFAVLEAAAGEIDRYVSSVG
jgi:hypothetical protein